MNGRAADLGAALGLGDVLGAGARTFDVARLPAPLGDVLGPALDLAPVLAFGVLEVVPCVRPLDVLEVVPPSWPRCRRARR